MDLGGHYLEVSLIWGPLKHNKMTVDQAFNYKKVSDSIRTTAAP